MARWLLSALMFLAACREPAAPTPPPIQPADPAPVLRARIESGRTARAYDYLRARAGVPQLLAALTELFEQRYDALITPATFGTAPVGLESTGDPAFCSTWTLLGVPTLSLPLMTGANGLPLGVQLVGARDADARLLRTARWLVERVTAG